MKDSNFRFGLFFWGLFALAAFVAINFAVLQGGILNQVKIVALLLPFLAIIFLENKKYWHVLLVVFLVTEMIVVPFYGLRKFPPNVIMLGLVALKLLFDIAMHKHKSIGSRNGVDNMVLAFGCIALARFAYDRPGFVALGSGAGGFMDALRYVLAPVFYFALRPVFIEAKFTRKQLWVVTVMVGLINVSMLHFAETGAGIYWGRKLAGPPSWLFCSCFLSLVITMPRHRQKEILFYLISLAFIGFGLISGFRSRTLFFAGEIMAISYFMRRTTKTLIVVGVAGVLGVTVLLAITGRVPQVMGRALSLFMHVESTEIGGQRYGAAGWEDSFRGYLYEFAWEDIKEHPLFGKGYKLDVAMALEILAVSDPRTSAEMLRLGGAYHNSVVVVTAKLGLPAGILFTLFSVIIAYRFARYIKESEDSDLRTWSMALFSFWVANTGMLLMNGGLRQYFACMILNGMMTAIMRREEEVVVPVPETISNRVAINHKLKRKLPSY